MVKLSEPILWIAIVISTFNALPNNIRCQCNIELRGVAAVFNPSCYALLFCYHLSNEKVSNPESKSSIVTNNSAFIHHSITRTNSHQWETLELFFLPACNLYNKLKNKDKKYARLYLYLNYCSHELTCFVYRHVIATRNWIVDTNLRQLGRIDTIIIYTGTAIKLHHYACF